MNNRSGPTIDGWRVNVDTQIEQQVRDFIMTNFLFGDTSRKLASDDSFLEKGIIDSTGVVQLVTFVEETFGIAVDDAELVPENLDSVEKLVRFIDRKRSAASTH